MKPRIGGGAVITNSVSPASGSTMRCRRPGLDNGTTTLASVGSAMFRTTTSGCGGVCIVSANVSVQFALPDWPSPVSEGICGRLRRMRIACPFSSGTWLTSEMRAPPLARIGSISTGFVESNTSHTASARRNRAAGVPVAKENFRRRPSLSRVATTEAALSPTLASGGGSDTAAAFGGGSVTAAFAGVSAAGAIVSFDDGSSNNGSFNDGAGIGGSGAGFVCGAVSGLISMLACSAMVSEVGGAIPLDFHDGEGSAAGFAGAAGAA